MTAPASPPSGPAAAGSPTMSDPEAPGEHAPPKGLPLKGWLAMAALVGGPLAFGTFATMNETAAALLSWIVSAYDKLSVAALGLSALLWIADKVRRR